MSNLKNGNPAEVHGAMRVFAEFARNDITDQQFPHLAPILFPELLRILLSEEAYSYRTRARSVAIFKNCIEMLFMVKEENPAAIDGYLKPILPTWMEAFLKLLSSQVTGDVEKQAGQFGLKLEIVKALNLTIQGFSKLISPYLSGFIEPIWNDLVNLKAKFIKEQVEIPDDVEVAQDSDGEDIGFDSLIYAQFEFLSLVSRKKVLKHLFSNSSKAGIPSFIKELVYVVIDYMQITYDQEELWKEDANQFVADEEEDTFSYNVRIAAKDLLISLTERYPLETITSLGEAAQRHIDESSSARSANNPNWWKVQEACLLAIGQASSEIIEGLEDPKSGVQFDIGGLFNHVVLDHMKCGDQHFLQGRAFVFASQFAKILPADLATQYISFAVNAIRKDQPVPIRVSALMALSNFCRYMDPQYVAPFQAGILEGVAEMVDDSSEETLILVLETLLSAVKINPEVTAAKEGVICPLVMNIWTRYPADHLIAGLVMDLFEALASNPLIYGPLQSRSVPILMNVIRNPGEDPAIVPSAIDLLASLVKGGPSPLPQGYIAAVLPDLMNVLMTTEDRDVLQSGPEFLRFAVQKDFDQILHLTDEHNKTGLDYVVQFIAKLLHPSQSESAALFVGDLIAKLIQKGGDRLSPIIPDLLKAVTLRLAEAQTSTFVQSLVLVFAHLIHINADTVVDFLASFDINGKNGLDILMQAWCDNCEFFSGFYAIKVSTLALAKLFVKADPRIEAIQVKGDLIPNNSNRIVTRSRARSNPDMYTTISVPSKIVKLLISEFQNDIDSMYTKQPTFGGAENLEGQESDEDGEWEDDENESPFAPAEDYDFLSELLDNGAEFEDEDDDPELASDPIYQTNVKSYLSDFFRNCVAQNTSHFIQICERDLNAKEQKKIASILA
ncbi:ARM repeat-containing protein [Basidiobolus meristosporus CBS 931.73]|uniref:ARM repeat-containing protein n=1 Tax=Basidiobolus meristosporus CBS 931.73 TaxID=1314790 RepID=A0A1Y1YCV4_9FUNG|nr:ARM repeat-containing protein [Basidiobolus meristosporus CBS 931.73]|eukprot:ORX95566.1 ARM repeat-containing protein [Basidiobolus meristosporus CBS 931.73]